MRKLSLPILLVLCLALTVPAPADPTVRVLTSGVPIQGTNGIAVGGS